MFQLYSADETETAVCETLRFTLLIEVIVFTALQWLCIQKMILVFGCCTRLAELARQLGAMQEEAVADIHASVEQFKNHLETTISALQDSTTQFSQSFKSVD